MAYVDDIEFVFSEAARIYELEKEAVATRSFEKLKLSLSTEDSFASLPDPSGQGTLTCGAAAHRRLADVVDHALSTSKFNGRLDRQNVLEALKKTIVEYFLREKRQLDAETAQLAVNAAIETAAAAITDLIHLLPCHLVQEEIPTSFSIGGVTFEKTEHALKRIETALLAFMNGTPRHPRQSEEHYSKITRDLVADAREYYGSFGWTALVRVDGCDPPTSKRRAEQIIQSALDCFQLLIGASHSHRMRAGGPTYARDKRSKIEINKNGVAEISTSLSWHGHHLGEDWWESINAQGGAEIIELVGTALTDGYDIEAPTLLSRRFLDAVAWYGEATRDQFPASSLVKYVTALEQMLITDNDSIEKTLANRGAALINDPESRDLDRNYSRFIDVYRWRSDVVHGRQSPHQSGMGPAIREAEELTRQVLLSSLQFFGRRGLEDKTVTIERLDQAYARLVDRASRARGNH
jgi:hypothetical protein